MEHNVNDNDDDSGVTDVLTILYTRFAFDLVYGDDYERWRQRLSFRNPWNFTWRLARGPGERCGAVRCARMCHVRHLLAPTGLTTTIFPHATEMIYESRNATSTKRAKKINHTLHSVTRFRCASARCCCRRAAEKPLAAICRRHTIARWTGGAGERVAERWKKRLHTTTSCTHARTPFSAAKWWWGGGLWGRFGSITSRRRMPDAPSPLRPLTGPTGFRMPTDQCNRRVPEATALDGCGGGGGGDGRRYW